jgi:hypothetical protein
LAPMPMAPSALESDLGFDTLLVHLPHLRGSPAG